MPIEPIRDISAVVSRHAEDSTANIVAAIISAFINCTYISILCASVTLHTRVGRTLPGKNNAAPVAVAHLKKDRRFIKPFMPPTSCYSGHDYNQKCFVFRRRVAAVP